MFNIVVLGAQVSIGITDYVMFLALILLVSASQTVGCIDLTSTPSSIYWFSLSLSVFFSFPLSLSHLIYLPTPFYLPLPYQFLGPGSWAGLKLSPVSHR